MTAVPPLALTMGEPAGIGGEITLAAWKNRDGLPPFFVIDDAGRLAALARHLGWDLPIAVLDDPAEAPALFASALPVLHRPLAAPCRPGRLDPANGPAVMAAIEEAVRLTGTGQAGAVVTNPIHKKALYDAGFRFPGHTEFLAALAGVDRVVMMLASPQLRVVPVTIHVALRQAIADLRAVDIVETARITARALTRDFAIAAPRLAITGLNPHAGEGGAMGREDLEIVAPAVAALRAEGIDARGPLPADTLFHARARESYDAALCMYHDQALIPIKTLDFDGGVNVTLGLPFVRTSPDHGTALDLAGRGQARPDSLMAALRLAASMAAARRETGHD